MKAVLLYEKDDLRFVEIPIPKVGPTDILIKVRAAKVCPTDIRKYRLGSKDTRIHSLPMNLCHEFTGDVVEVGEKVTTIKKDMRIIGTGFAGNAEYVLIPGKYLTDPRWTNRVLELPENISYEKGTFAVPLSECMHCVIDQARCKFGDIIVIVGAGQMGLMQANIAHNLGATVIVSEPLEPRLRLAKEFGADYTINPSKESVIEAVRGITDGGMADCAVATLGNPEVIDQAISVTKDTGRIVIFGGAPAGSIMQFDPNILHYTEKILVGSYGLGLDDFGIPNRYNERRKQALQYMAKGRIPLDKLLMIMPMDDIVKAYEMIERKEILTAVLIP